MTAHERVTVALTEALTLDGWTRYHGNPAMAQTAAIEYMRRIGPAIEDVIRAEKQQALRGAEEAVSDFQYAGQLLAALRARADALDDELASCSDEHEHITAGGWSVELYCEQAPGHVGPHSNHGVTW